MRAKKKNSPGIESFHFEESSILFSSMNEHPVVYNSKFSRLTMWLNSTYLNLWQKLNENIRSNELKVISMIIILHKLDSQMETNCHSVIFTSNLTYIIR